MTYKILSARQEDITIITTVEYNLDGTIVTTEVPHFMPKSQEEIEQNIINKAAKIDKMPVKIELNLKDSNTAKGIRYSDDTGVFAILQDTPLHRKLTSEMKPAVLRCFPKGSSILDPDTVPDIAISLRGISGKEVPFGVLDIVDHTASITIVFASPYAFKTSNSTNVVEPNHYKLMITIPITPGDKLMQNVFSL